MLKTWTKQWTNINSKKNLLWSCHEVNPTWRVTVAQELNPIRRNSIKNLSEWRNELCKDDKYFVEENCGGGTSLMMMSTCSGSSISSIFPDITWIGKEKIVQSNKPYDFQSIHFPNFEITGGNTFDKNPFKLIVKWYLVIGKTNWKTATNYWKTVSAIKQKK